MRAVYRAPLLANYSSTTQPTWHGDQAHHIEQQACCRDHMPTRNWTHLHYMSGRRHTQWSPRRCMMSIMKTCSAPSRQTLPYLTPASCATSQHNESRSARLQQYSSTPVGQHLSRRPPKAGPARERRKLRTRGLNSGPGLNAVESALA